MTEKHRKDQRRHYQRKKAQLAEAQERAKAGEPVKIPEYFERHRHVMAERYNNVIKPRREAMKALKKDLEAQWEAEHGNLGETKAVWIKQQLELRMPPKEPKAHNSRADTANAGAASESTEDN